MGVARVQEGSNRSTQTKWPLKIWAFWQMSFEKLYFLLPTICSKNEFSNTFSKLFVQKSVFRPVLLAGPQPECLSKIRHNIYENSGIRFELSFSDVRKFREVQNFSNYLKFGHFWVHGWPDEPEIFGSRLTKRIELKTRPALSKMHTFLQKFDLDQSFYLNKSMTTPM